jgi:hypothetical protein
MKIPRSVQEDFQSCSLKEGHSRCQLIGSSAFEMTSISEMRIPATVESIGDSAFHSLRSFKEISFENRSRCESIGNLTFQKAAIFEMKIPAAVQSIVKWAFRCLVKSFF